LTFRIVDVMKPPAWSIPWGPKEDSMLLLGVYRHGIGNWESITTDNSLGLQAVHETKIKAAQLMRRVEALFRMLSDPSASTGDQQPKPKPKKKESKPKPSAQKRSSPDAEKGGEDEEGNKGGQEKPEKPKASSSKKKESVKKEKDSDSMIQLIITITVIVRVEEMMYRHPQQRNLVCRMIKVSRRKRRMSLCHLQTWILCMVLGTCSPR